MAGYTPMIEQYLSIKADVQDAFLFFRLGDFYEMFFEDAEKAAKILEITLTSRDGGSDKKIPMCGVPYHSAESYINKLIDYGYKVAVCEQTEDPKLAKGVVKREVVRIITPGTIMEGKIVEEKGNNYIASIAFFSKGIYGISISDITTGEFYATEITGDIENVFNELMQYQPSEIIVSNSLSDILKTSFSQLNTTVTVAEDIKAELESYYNKLVIEQFNNLKINSLSGVLIISIGQLLNYLQKTQQKKLTHFNELQIYDTKQYMVLDIFSKRNLELTKTLREQTKKGSFLWLLDQTETAMGSRLLRRWIEKPLLSVSEIDERLNSVEAFYNDPILLDDVKRELKQVYDIERLISKIAYGNSTPRDLFALRKSLEKIPVIYKFLLESKNTYLVDLMSNIDLCQDIARIIELSIQDDPPLSVKDGGLIKRGFNEQLDKYYLAGTESKKWLQDLELRERELTGIKSLKVGFNKVFGYYIEITKANLTQVPANRYIRKQTLANAERYVTEELKEQEIIILEAEEKMLDLEYQLFAGVREQIAKHILKLQILAQHLAKIDVLLSFAIISLKYKYTRPQLNHDGFILITEGRHPVVESVLDGQPYIPNDVQMDQNNNEILLITGPNMAGKSTYMRQIALTVIMTQIGCFVPAREANMPIIDRIFTRIGAGDDLTSGQSTFMVEMVETKNAITQATANSLILLDEIGRGTSTYDGMAIAQAIIQYIHEKVRAKTLFSTHYHELTSLADHYSRIQNIHVNVIEKDGKVIFLHKIEKGKADRSYGIHVAELAGMPTEVIASAKKILMELESKKVIEHSEQKQLKIFDFDQNLNIENQSKLHLSENSKEKAIKQVIKQIEAIDLLNMTPMDGFQILYDLQKKLRK